MAFSRAALKTILPAIIGMACCLHGAQAQNAKVLRIVVDYPAGGVPDVIARGLGQKITESTGQVVVVENRPGAGGQVAINDVANSAPDGYTLLLGQTGSYAIAPHLLQGPYAFGTTLKPVALVASAPVLLVANSKENIASVRDLIARAKADSTLTYGSSGNGSAHHLAMELLKAQAHIPLTHIPYKGSPQSTLAVSGGEVKLAFLGLNNAIPQEKAGLIKILGIATPRRSELAPNIPTIAEGGLPGYGISVTLGLFAPVNAPAAAVETVRGLVANALQDDALKAKLGSLGIEVDRRNLTPDGYASLIRAEYEEYGAIVKTAKLKLD